MTARDLPWMKYSPDRWRNDAELSICSLAARGLWVEMMNLMHKAEPYGHLLINGRAPTEKQLAALCRCSLLEMSPLLDELEANGVLSRDESGTVFCRGMVRDAEVSDEMSRRGTKGAKARYSNEKTGSHSKSHGTGNGTSHGLELEREKEEEKKPPVIPRGNSGSKPGKVKIPDDWAPGSFEPASATQNILDAWSDERFRREAESFRAHHRRKGSRYEDWHQTWGGWVRNAATFQERDDRRDAGRAAGRSNEPKSHADIVLEEIEREKAAARRQPVTQP